MASIWYGIEFSWNKLLGYSILKNPMELIGFGIIIIVIGLIIFILNYLIKSYKETKMGTTLLWILGFSFLLVGIIFLILDKFSYSTLGNAPFGDLMAILAIITSGIGIVFFDVFAFHITYPEREKILTLLFSILAAIYIVTLCSAIIAGPPTADVVNYELVYIPIVNIIVYITLLPIMLIAPGILIYYYSRMRNKNRPNALRAFWMGIGLLAFAIEYIAEAAPFFPPRLAIPMRVLFVIAGAILYICLSMPDWFKDRIGWTD